MVRAVSSRFDARRAVHVAAGIVVALVIAPVAMGQQPPLLEVGGRLHFHATDFDDRLAQSNGRIWEIVPDDHPGKDEYNNANPSFVCDPTGQTRYMHTPEDSGGRTDPPFDPGNSKIVVYAFAISTPGDYRIWARLASVDGGDDSFFLRIRERGAKGILADWWRVDPPSQGGTFNWQGDGGAGQQTGAGAQNEEAMIETLAPGTYHLEMAQREQGSAFDELVIDSTATFDGSDAGADAIPCSVRCPDVTEVSYVPGDTVNLPEIDLPVSLGISVAIPSASNGTVTITSSDAGFIADQAVGFTTDGGTCGAATVELTSAGSATLSLSNDMGFTNGSSREINVIALQSVDLALTSIMVRGGTQQATVTADFGAAGVRDTTESATGVVYASDNESAATVGVDGEITASEPGVATITATLNGQSASRSILVVGALAGGGGDGPLLEVGGVLRFEAEDFDEGTVSNNGDEWKIIPDEEDDTFVSLGYTDSVGDCLDGTPRHIEALPSPPTGGNGNTGGDVFAAGPMVSYVVTITTPGTYQFWIKAGGADGNSDSGYFRIREVHGTEWFLWNPDGGSSMRDAWRGVGTFGNDTSAGPGGGGDPMNTDLVAGTYHVDIVMREDGLALDQIVLDSTGTFDGTDGGALQIPCSARCPAVTTVAHTIEAPINIQEQDIPQTLVLNLAIPDLATGTVTVTSTDPAVAGGGLAGFADFTDARCGATEIDVIGVGSTTLELSNDMGFDNGPGRAVNVIAIQSVDLIVEPGMELGDAQQGTVIAGFNLPGVGDAGTRDVTTAADGTVYTVNAVDDPDGTGVVSVSPDGVITALGVGTAEVTATNSAADTETVVVFDRLTRIAFLVGELELGRGDQAVLDHLRGLRFVGIPGQLDASGRPPKVVLFDDNDFDESVIDLDFDLLITSSTVASGAVGGRFRCLSIPHIYWESLLNQAEREGLTTCGDNTEDALGPGAMDPPTFTELFALDSGHPISQDLAANEFIAVYDTPQIISFAGAGDVARCVADIAAGIRGMLATGARLLADHEFEAEGTIVVAGPAGDPDLPLGDGFRVDGESPFLGRRVFLWFHDDTFGRLNAVGLDVFNKSVNWALASARLPSEVSGVTIAPAGGLVLCPGLEFGVTVRAVAPAGCAPDFTDPATGTTYETGDAGVATVDEFGLVTGIELGSTMLTVRNGDFSATIPIDVVADGCPTGFLETTGILKFEAEDFDESTPNSSGTQFLIVPDEDPGLPYLDPSGACNDDGVARHVESLPDGGGGPSGFPDGPRVVYEFTITTPGAYHIWVRSSAESGTSDSFFMRIRETAGDNWWRFNPDNSNGTFADNWQGFGGFGMGAGAGPGDGGNVTGDMIESFSPGTYHLEIAMREDGSGLDQIILDSTGTFDGTDGVAEGIACAKRTVFRCTEEDAPQLIGIVGGMTADMLISPLGENVALTSFDIEVSEAVSLSGTPGIAVSGGTAPTDVTLTAGGAGPNGGVLYTVTLTGAAPVGNWTTLTLGVVSDAGCEGTLTMSVAHQPLDINLDGASNIGDATAFGAEFGGARDLSRIDLNGDGLINVQDATAFGDNWFGRGVATTPWANTALPPKP